MASPFFFILLSLQFNINSMDTPQKNSTHLPLILSSLALAGVAALFILKFMGNNDQPGQIQLPPSGQGHTIAYINTDSILANYDLVKELENQLKDKTQKMENQLAGRQKELDKEAEYFQKSVNNKSLSEQSAQEIYQQLMAKQQGIAEQKEAFRQELAYEDMKINAMLIDTVTNFLKRFNQKTGYDYVLGYNKTGNIFLTNDTFDITNVVLEQLNREYAKKNPNPAK